MKSKFILLALILFSIFTSCSKQPICDDEASIKLAKQLILQEMNEKIVMNYGMIGIDVKKALEEFVDENVEITNARTTAKDEDLRKCDCSSQIYFKYPDDFIQKVKDLESKSFMNGVLSTKISKPLNYHYNLQLINKNDDLFAEGILPIQELNDIFSFYLMTSIEFSRKAKNKEQNIVLEKNKEILEDSIKDETINNDDLVTNNSNSEQNDSYSAKEAKHQLDVDKAIEMLKQNKSVAEILKSTSLLRPEIQELAIKVRNEK